MYGGTWAGCLSQTIAGETPLLCIILKSRAAVQRQAVLLLGPRLETVRWPPVGHRAAGGWDLNPTPYLFYQGASVQPY